MGTGAFLFAFVVTVASVSAAAWRVRVPGFGGLISCLIALIILLSLLVAEIVVGGLSWQQVLNFDARLAPSAPSKSGIALGLFLVGLAVCLVGRRTSDTGQRWRSR